MKNMVPFANKVLLTHIRIHCQFNMAKAMINSKQKYEENNTILVRKNDLVVFVFFKGIEKL